MERVKKNEWQEKEKEWISKYYKTLINDRMGGEGGSKSKYKLTISELKEWVKLNLKNIKTKNEWNNYWKVNKSLKKRKSQLTLTLFIKKMVVGFLGKIF